MPELIISDIQKSFGANEILKGVTFEVERRTVTGIVGSNGCGKTTLFKIIAGLEYPDGGAVHKRSGTRIGYLEQMPEVMPDVVVKDVLEEAFADLYRLERELRDLEQEISSDNVSETLINRYGNLQHIFEARGGYKIAEKFKRVAIGLNINEEMQQKKFQKLSGGEKTRVLLGRILLEETDMLLLDEPTNHLDIQSIEWLEGFLESYEGTALIISHDRYFMDRVIDGVIEISGGKAVIYKGNYSNYTITKQKQAEAQEELYERQEKTLNRLEAAAKRLHDWALHTKAFSMEKRIEKIARIDKPQHESSLKLNLKGSEFRGKEVIKGENMYFSYGTNKPVLADADFYMTKEDRVAIVGSNGCGKTTFLKLLMNELELNSGSLKLGNSAKYAYLEQNIVFDRPGRSVFDLVRDELDMKDRETRNLLARYKFVGDDVFKPLSVLSGGEKSRLKLCLLLVSEINLLILDEPTNHLDIASRETLENVMMEYDGALVFVSHDRYFINKFATCIYELNNGKFKIYDGDYDYYRQEKSLEETLAEAERDSLESEAQEEDPEQKKARSRARDAWRINKVSGIEDEIEKNELRLREIDSEMFENGNNYEKICELEKLKAQVEAEISSLLEEWEKYST